MAGPSRILGPVAGGSGASIVHRALERYVEGYRVVELDPRPLGWIRGLATAGSTPVDLVHAPPDHAVLFTRPRVPLVLTFHNYVLDPELRRSASSLQKLRYDLLLRPLTRRALGRAAAVTAVSRSTAELVRTDAGFPAEVEVIRNGVDCGVFRPPSDRPRRSTVRVLFSGNPTLRKGGDLLAPLAALLPPSVELVVTGGMRGSGKRWLRSPRIRLLGPVPHGEMPEVYRRADLLLLPTLREGSSLSVLEAMASGLPVVASRCPSVEEQVADGVGGYLCPPGEVRGFAERIEALAADEPLRRRMGEHNRHRAAADFPLESMVEGYRRLFARVL